MSQPRAADLQTFLSLTQAAIERRTGKETPAALAMGRVEAALRRPAPARQTARRSAAAAPPACAHLSSALDNTQRAGGDLADVARALRTLAPHISWRLRESDDTTFMCGHANADLVGSSENALEQRDDVRVGLSLMAPGITYPDHHHPPEEVYLVLSEGDWRQEARPWHAPGIGGIVYNPPAIVHAMRSHAAPLLAIWCLPI